MNLLSKQLYIPTLHLTKYKFDKDVTGLVPERIARQYKMIPISRMGNTLTVAMSDPLNIFALDDLKVLTGCNIDSVLCGEDEILRAIDAEYSTGTKSMQQLLEDSASEAVTGKKNVELFNQEDLELSSALKDSEKPPIVKLVDLMLTQALKRRASDIHIEPEEDALRIRYRVDGSLHDAFNVPKINQNAVLARVKIIANLDITENRVPQDGRFKVRFEGKEVDFRVSSLPTTFGQKFVLRLLDKANLSIGLDKLGFSEQPATVFKQAIAKP
ncbi:MAG: ATPase, T2SS/T4P/T4SS family, partial [Candidatus Omnitrophica bacterium]|nr:ATPase, T2SS/T4P/T4SS family [Candidatus Omnitrophota bacterium]